MPKFSSTPWMLDKFSPSSRPLPLLGSFRHRLRYLVNGREKPYCSMTTLLISSFKG
jgi:hypothetical protein